MTAVKITILLAAFSFVAIAATAKTVPLAKGGKPAATIDSRWPQVSVRETLEYLAMREELDVLDPHVPGDRAPQERDREAVPPHHPTTH